MQQQIETVLMGEFTPQLLLVENESYLHSSGKGSNSHFKVVLISDVFVDKPLLARHRAVQSSLKPVTVGVHALSLHTYTRDEWLARGGEVPESPSCAGGGRYF
jgi:BolA protein